MAALPSDSTQAAEYAEHERIRDAAANAALIALTSRYPGASDVESIAAMAYRIGEAMAQRRAQLRKIGV